MTKQPETISAQIDTHEQTLSGREFMKQLKAGTLKPVGPQRLCSLCEKPFSLADLQEGLQGIKDGEAHSDCYFEALGDAIEQHPIRSPQRVYGVVVI